MAPSSITSLALDISTACAANASDAVPLDYFTRADDPALSTIWLATDLDIMTLAVGVLGNSMDNLAECSKMAALINQTVAVTWVVNDTNITCSPSNGTFTFSIPGFAADSAAAEVIPRNTLPGSTVAVRGAKRVNKRAVTPAVRNGVVASNVGTPITTAAIVGVAGGAGALGAGPAAGGQVVAPESAVSQSASVVAVPVSGTMSVSAAQPLTAATVTPVGYATRPLPVVTAAASTGGVPSGPPAGLVSSASSGVPGRMP